MNKFISFSKAFVVIAAVLMTSGFSLSNVFAEEYASETASVDGGVTSAESAVPHPIAPEDKIFTDGPDATDIAPVDTEVVPGPTASELSPADSDVTPSEGPTASEIGPVDEETPTTPPTPNEGGRRRGSSTGGSRATQVQGQVLGAESFQFLSDLRVGMTGNDVMELQKRLRAEGYFTYPTDTGYFGQFTLAAVKAYQQAHFAQIGFVTGFVGPLTRAVLNM